VKFVELQCFSWMCLRRYCFPGQRRSFSSLVQKIQKLGFQQLKKIAGNFKRERMRVRMWVCVSACVYPGMCVCVVCFDFCVCICMCRYVFMLVNRRACMCICIHIHEYIHIYIYHGSKPLTRNKISEISQWQKCFSELKISNPRISCTGNGVRRSS